ncbi:Nucleotide-binding- alpha-beta plait [Apiospora kogelbergensis]|uniref:Nucleotide-binding- alpha-beta plait n=1 Tax=Apiospora kogelbergensis TaxID=1337665 RepID=UPI003131AE85
MTEHHQLQPEVVASADLEPCSPKPINLSSPATVPALQNQVDAYYTMSQHPAADSLSAAAALAAHGSVANHIDHIQSFQAVSPIQLNGDGAHGVAEATSGGEQEDNEQKAYQSGMADTDGDDYAKAFDSPAAEVADGPEDDISQGNASTTSVADAKVPTITEPSSDAVPSTEIKSPAEHPAQPTEPSLQAYLERLQAQGDQLAQPDRCREPPPKPVEADPKSAQNAPGATQPDDPIDIQALVDTITARATASDANQATSPAKPDDSQTGAKSQHLQAQAPAQTSSLPPRPPVSQQPTSASLHAEEAKRFPHATNVPGTFPVPPSTGMSYSYGTDVNYPPPPTMNSTANPAMPITPYSNAPGVTNNIHPSEPQQQQTYEIFLQEERKYVSEAKWDRFPEGSRLFIGNLSSERVSKREVFDIFSRFGRMAQISLKQAYGFVQYHDVAEGKAATENLQGVEVGGRKINLEPTRAQGKKENDSDRQRGNRGKGNNANDRGRADGRRRDDYRPRSPSPARANHFRQGSFGRDRTSWGDSSSYGGRSRGRSRSPATYGGGGYRRRSPSPHYRGPPTTEADLDIPRRYAGDVPDVQLLLLQEVDRDFVTWVQRSFVDRGLKVDVMFLNPRFPRDLVIQRQIVEGVHGVSELDYRAQSIAKIPLQVFDRSGGRHNARFDQYQDLDPAIAAELVARAKSLAQVPSPASYGGPYAQAPYAPAPHQPVHGYPGQQPLAHPGLAGLGNLDNATLQKVLAAMQPTTQSAIPGQQPMMPSAGVDVNSILGALGGSGAAPPPMPQHAPQHQHAASYPPVPYGNIPLRTLRMQAAAKTPSMYKTLWPSCLGTGSDRCFVPDRLPTQ